MQNLNAMSTEHSVSGAGLQVSFLLVQAEFSLSLVSSKVMQKLNCYYLIYNFKQTH